MKRIDLEAPEVFYDLSMLRQDRQLCKNVKACIEAQKRAGLQLAAKQDLNVAAGQRAVSPAALDEILAGGKEVSDIRVSPGISNCIVFHTRGLDGSVIDDSLLELRRRADDTVRQRLGELVGPGLTSEVSGHFWYPPGGYMGWHTNLRKPGWRMYVNYAEEPGRSFFRYRDPVSGKIVTCVDEQWNFRLFKIDPSQPFWHAVYSETDRFSLGYKIEKAA